jgi:hypothetical protein
MQMPNTAGCMHTWPSSLKQINGLLAQLGVVVRKNVGAVIPYPYKPQGLLSMVQID